MAAPAFQAQPCSTHPRSTAAWRCQGCDRHLCEECAYTSKVGYTEVIACSTCGELAVELKAHRSRIPFAQRLPRAALRPLNRDSLITMAGVAGLHGALMWATTHSIGPTVMLSFATAMGIFWGYLLLVIRAASQSSDGDLEPPEFNDFFEDLLGPAMKGVLATAIVWGPAGAYLVGHEGGVVGALQSPMLWLIFLLGLLYAPMALMVAAAGGGVLQMLNPVGVVAHAVRLGRDYLLAIAALVPLGAAYAALSVVSWLLKKIPFPPFLGAWLGETLTLYPITVGAVILGQVLYARGDSIDYGRAEEYLEPVVPGAVPRGPPFQRRAPAVVEVAEVVPVELPPGGGPPGGSAGDLLSEVAARVQREDLEGAVQLYTRVHDAELWQLPGEVHVAVGQKAAAKGSYALAVKALKQAAQNDVDPAAPKACVILARLYGERLRDPATAEKLYRHVIARYPDTQAAEFARSKMGG